MNIDNTCFPKKITLYTIKNYEDHKSQEIVEVKINATEIEEIDENFDFVYYDSVYDGDNKDEKIKRINGCVKVSNNPEIEECIHFYRKKHAIKSAMNRVGEIQNYFKAELKNCEKIINEYKNQYFRCNKEED